MELTPDQWNDLTERVTRLEHTAAIHDARITSLIELLGSEVASLAVAVNNGFAQMHDRFDRMGDKLDRIDHRFDNHDDRFAEILTAIERLGA